MSGRWRRERLRTGLYGLREQLAGSLRATCEVAWMVADGVYRDDSLRGDPDAVTMRFRLAQPDAETVAIAADSARCSQAEIVRCALARAIAMNDPRPVFRPCRDTGAEIEVSVSEDVALFAADVQRRGLNNSGGRGHGRYWRIGTWARLAVKADCPRLASLIADGARGRAAYLSLPSPEEVEAHGAAARAALGLPPRGSQPPSSTLKET